MKKVLAVLLLATAAAHAGGTVRPNGISARGVGMGGAWAAWADDATAIYFNPGALDAVDPHVMLGAEVVLGPRTFTPRLNDGTDGPAQSATVLAPAPTLGVVGRFNYDDQPSRFTLGLGVWNTFGGQIDYPKTGMPALDLTEDICIEIDGAAAVHISDKLSVGGAIRFGIGLFHVVATQNPFDADLSAKGVGVGMGWGALFRPTDKIRVGLTWRSPLRVKTKGSGPVDGNLEDIEHIQEWPQTVALGVGVQAAPKTKVAAEVDWTQWSIVEAIVVGFPGPLPDQVYPEYWRDNWTLRAGLEQQVAERIAVRGGAYFDTIAVPDLTIERQYEDSNKIGLSLGASFDLGGWRFDTALDGIIPRTRTVPNNTNEVMGFGALQNKAPGDYRGSLITFELAAARRF